MEHLIGLEWSTGLFGLSIGILIGCVATWHSLCATIAADLRVNVDDLQETQVSLVSESPVHEPAPNPFDAIGIRILHRLANAYDSEDVAAQYRHMARLTTQKIKPPADAESCRELAAAMEAAR